MSYFKMIFAFLIIFILLDCKTDDENPVVEVNHNSFSLSSTIEDAEISSALSIEKVDNNNYIIICIGDNRNTKLIQYNNSSKTKEVYTFESTHLEEMKDAHLTLDNGIIAAGIKGDIGQWLHEAYIIKINQNSEIEWTKTFSSNDKDAANSITEISDGGYIFTGDKIVGNNTDWIITKLDDSGNEVWTKTFDDTIEDKGYSIVQSGENGETTTLGTGLVDLSTYKLVIKKLDGDSNLLWSKELENVNRYAFYHKLIRSNDNGYVVVSTTTSNILSEDDDILLLKLDDEGNELWRHTYGGVKNDRGISIIQNDIGEYIILGSTNSYREEAIDIFLAKINEKGEQLWSSSYGTKEYNIGYDLIQKEDGGYLICGTNGQNGATNYDMVLIEVNAEGVPE